MNSERLARKKVLENKRTRRRRVVPNRRERWDDHRDIIDQIDESRGQELGPMITFSAQPLSRVSTRIRC